MEPRPPRLIERIAEVFVPPACREPVMGDLYERYISPSHYLIDCLVTIPAVVFSRMRRTFDLRWFLADAVALYGSFFAFQWQSGEPFALISAAVSVAMGALALHDVYVTRMTPASRSMLGSAVAMLTAGLLGGVAPWMAFRCAAIWLLLMAASYGRTEKDPTPAPVSNDHRTAAIEFEAKVRSRNRGELIAVAAVVLGFAAFARLIPDALFRLACALIIIGALYVAYQLRRRTTPRRVPELEPVGGYAAFYCEESAMQRDALYSIFSWYLAPLIPGLALFLVCGFLAPTSNMAVVGAVGAVAIVLFAGIWKANHAAAARLQRQIDALDPHGREALPQTA